MEIVLKDIRVDDRRSDDSTCFSALIYVDDVRAGVASNDGNGGMTDYRGQGRKGEQLLKEAEEYCRKLPPITIEGEAFGGKDLTLKMDLSIFLEDLLNKHLGQKAIEKQNKKIEKAMRTGIVVGIPDKTYRVWDLKYPLTEYFGKE